MLCLAVTSHYIDRLGLYSPGEHEMRDRLTNILHDDIVMFTRQMIVGRSVHTTYKSLLPTALHSLSVGPQP